MALSTLSKFFYGHTVDSTNNAIDFSEGGGELQATIVSKDYSITEYATAIKTAMDAAGGQAYTVTIDRTTAMITISAPGTFELLISSGTRSGTSSYGLMGFTGADLTGASSYEGDSVSGSVFEPQMTLQDYTPSTNFREPVKASVHETGTGREVAVRFGERKLIRMSIRFQNDITQPGDGPITSNASGLDDLRSFLQYIDDKRAFEFMADKNTPSTFEKVVLRSSPSRRDGLGYRLMEKVNRGLAGYFDIGPLILKVRD